MTCAIQPGGPGTTVTCPCGHQDEYAGDAANEVVTCDQCRARLAYGVKTPRWSHLPHQDPRFVRVRISEFEVVLDRDFLRAVALDALSVCPPPALAKPEPSRVEKLLAEMAALDAPLTSTPSKDAADG